MNYSKRVLTPENKRVQTPKIKVNKKQKEINLIKLLFIK